MTTDSLLNIILASLMGVIVGGLVAVHYYGVAAGLITYVMARG